MSSAIEAPSTMESEASGAPSPPPGSVLAAALGLPLKLEVVLDAECDEAFRLLTQGRRAEEALSRYWVLLTPFYLSLAIGVYGCLQANLILSAIFIVVCGFSLLKVHLADSTIAKFSGVSASPPITVVVTIAEDGISEMDRGVESRMAWSAMTRWFLVRDILFINLANGKWAVIPSRKMKPVVGLHKLTSLLKIQGISGKELNL